MYQENKINLIVFQGLTSWLHP